MKLIFVFKDAFMGKDTWLWDSRRPAQNYWIRLSEDMSELVFQIKNFLPYRPETLRYAKVWESELVF